MGVEILAADLVSGSVKDATGQDTALISDMDKNVKPTQGKDLEEPIKFGLVDSTQATNGQTKAEVDHAKNDNFPKDVVEEWPEPKQIHTFYFVKYQSYEDLKLKAKLEQVDREIQKRSKERFQITEALKSKRSERSHIISQLKPLTDEDKQYREIIDGKRKEMEPLQAALGKLRNVNNAERGMGLCSSEEELDSLIQSLHYCIQHESNTLAEEKQLLKDIKQLEGTRQKVIANVATRAKLQDSLGPKEVIQDQVKLIGVDLDGVRKEQQTVRAKIRNLEEELKSVDEEISSLQEELTTATQKRYKAYETLNELRKTRDEGNACYYKNRVLLNNARDLAAQKDVAALEKLSHDEVEKFMSQWSGNKAFRDDYERRILSSLDRRQLSRDCTMRNPDEKPILSEAVTSVEPETSVVKGNVKNQKENADAPAQHTNSQKEPKDGGKKLTGTETKEKSTVEDAEKISLSERKKPLATPEIDAVKLKEIRREEEIARAKLALERKKKLAEKAAAKAAAWSQKEAEKKFKETIASSCQTVTLQEREKRAKKKAGSSVPDNPEEPTEVGTKTEEPQEAEETNDAHIPPKFREQKENVRLRTRSKGRDQLPKLILKRRRLHSYWLWAASAVIPVLAIVIAGYFYSFGRN